MKNSLWSSEERRPLLRAFVFIVLVGILTLGAGLAVRSIIQESHVITCTSRGPHFDTFGLILETPMVLVMLCWLLGASLIFWLVAKKNPFWNSKEHRMRALWRLVAQFLLLLVPVAAVFLCPLLAVILIFGWNEVMACIMGLLSLPIALFSVLLAGRLLDRRPFADFGFHFSRRWWIDFAFGLALGAVLVVGIFLVERDSGWIRYTEIVLSPWEPVTHALVIGLTIFLFSLINGVQVQLVSRGYQMRNLAEGLNLPFMGPRAALLLAYIGSSFIFLLPLSHYLLPRYGFFNEAALFTINLIINSLFLGLGYLLTGELAIPIGLHAGWTFSEGLLFGQGTTMFELLEFGREMSIVETFVRVYEVGPALWTGRLWTGSRYLGLEASLLGLPAAVIGSLLIVLWVRWRHGRLELQERLAEYRLPIPPEPQTEGGAE